MAEPLDIEPPPVHLFVYGSLLPWASGEPGQAERAKLFAEGRLLGRGGATTAGRLLDLGAYPALADGPGLVHGAAYHLNLASASTLAWLDAYEGITGRPNDEYVRREQPIQLDDGLVLSAWVYAYRLPVEGRRVIPSGIWAMPA